MKKLKLHELVGQDGVLGYVCPYSGYQNIYYLYLIEKGEFKKINYSDNQFYAIKDDGAEGCKQKLNGWYHTSIKSVFKDMYLGIDDDERGGSSKIGKVCFIPETELQKDFYQLQSSVARVKDESRAAFFYSINEIEKEDLGIKTGIGEIKTDDYEDLKSALEKLQGEIEGSPEYNQYEKYVTYRDFRQKKGDTGSYEEYKKRLSSAHNFIISGPPGVGKSWLVNKNILPYLIDADQHEQYYSRVVFTPGIMYEDFFGGYKPVSSEDGRISYKFKAGVFAELLGKALSDRMHNYVLVIEELNRAQVYDVFGLLFQLLDRDEEQCSEAPVEIPADAEGSEWEDEIKKSLGDKNKIYLPENLYIVCTMNPADQGVNVLDTAFLRRFSMAYIDYEGKLWCAKSAPIDFKKLEEEESRFFNGHSLEEEKAKDLYKALREAINKKLKAENMTDDKLISEHFIKNRGDDMEVVMGLCYYLSTIFRTPDELGRILNGERLNEILDAYKKLENDDSINFNSFTEDEAKKVCEKLLNQ